MGTDLIAEYLDALHSKLRSRRDVDDLIAEAADHLHDHAEHLVAEGHDRDDAARRAIDIFGDPAVVARAYLTSPKGALAVPTHSTRDAGTLACVARRCCFVIEDHAQP